MYVLARFVLKEMARCVCAVTVEYNLMVLEEFRLSNRDSGEV